MRHWGLNALGGENDELGGTTVQGLGGPKVKAGFSDGLFDFDVTG